VSSLLLCAPYSLSNNKCCVISLRRRSSIIMQPRPLSLTPNRPQALSLAFSRKPLSVRGHPPFFGPLSRTHPTRSSLQLSRQPTSESSCYLHKEYPANVDQKTTFSFFCPMKPRPQVLFQHPPLISPRCLLRLPEMKRRPRTAGLLAFIKVRSPGPFQRLSTGLNVTPLKHSATTPTAPPFFSPRIQPTGRYPHFSWPPNRVRDSPFPHLKSTFRSTLPEIVSRSVTALRQRHSLRQRHFSPGPAGFTKSPPFWALPPPPPPPPSCHRPEHGPLKPRLPNPGSANTLFLFWPQEYPDPSPQFSPPPPVPFPRGIDDKTTPSDG